MWWNKLVTRVTLTTRTNFWIWYHIKKNKTGKVLIRILIFTICKLWPSPFPVSSFSYFSWHWYLTKLLQKFSRVPSFRLPFWGAIFAVFLPESCLKFGTEESANSSNFQFHRILGGWVRFWLTFEILKLFEMAGLICLLIFSWARTLSVSAAVKGCVIESFEIALRIKTNSVGNSENFSKQANEANEANLT